MYFPCLWHVGHFFLLKTKIVNVLYLKGPYYAHFHICMLCLYTVLNVQKGMYFSHTACAAAPLFTLCLKPTKRLFPNQLVAVV